MAIAWQRLVKASRSWLSALRGPFLVMLIGVGLLAALGLIRFGSVSCALAYMRGYALCPECAVVSAGEITPGTKAEVAFRLWNVTGGDVTIAGVMLDCPCARTSKLPITIRPREFGVLDVSFTPTERQSGTSVKYRAYLFLDVDTEPIVLAAEADVVAAPLAAGGESRK